MTLDIIAELALRWAVPFVLTGAASLIGARCGTRRERLKKASVRDETIGLGLQCLLRAEIIRSAEKYHDKGFCPVYAREALQRAYDSYHNLGGNDVATELYRRTMALPSDPEKPEKEDA